MDEIVLTFGGGAHSYVVTGAQVVTPPTSGSSTSRWRTRPRSSPAIRRARRGSATSSSPSWRAPEPGAPHGGPHTALAGRRRRGARCRRPRRLLPPAVGLVAAGLRRHRHPRPAGGRAAAPLPLRPDVAVRARLAGPWHGLDVVPRRPGYIVAVGHRTLPRPGGGDRPGRAVAPARAPAALTVAEAVRFVWPFGGVPLASLWASARRCRPSARRPVGGVLLITWLTFLAGSALSAAWERSWRRRPSSPPCPWRSCCSARSPVGPRHRTLADGSRWCRAVGRRGAGRRHRPREVFERHLARPAQITEPVDLVVWPENVIDVGGEQFATSRELAEVAAEAARLEAPFSVGITEDAGDCFANAQVVVTPRARSSQSLRQGAPRPLRRVHAAAALLRAIRRRRPTSCRDALPGTGPRCSICRRRAPGGGDLVGGLLRRSGARRRVARGTAAAQPDERLQLHGHDPPDPAGGVVRLRALETGRWVVQVAPTGFCAFVTPTGEVLDRTGISEQAVRVRRGPPARGARSQLARRAPLCGGAGRRRAGLLLGPRWPSGRSAADPGSEVSRPRGGRVTGPSLTSSTCISVRKRPVATVRRGELVGHGLHEGLGVVRPGRLDPGRAAGGPTCRRTA